MFNFLFARETPGKSSEPTMPEPNIDPPTTDCIDVWLSFYEDIDDHALTTAYYTMLTEREKAQEQRFHFAADRRRYLVARALVRTTLSRYTSIDPAALIFSANAYGKPHIEETQSELSQLTFNLSHTQGLIALAITKTLAIGVDVESVCARPNPFGIAENYFSPDEITEFNRVSPDQKTTRFYEFWTLKESYIKARGLGLSIPLNKFSFRLQSDNDIGFFVTPELSDDARRWRFWQLQVDPNHLLAICSENDGAREPVLKFRNVIPLLLEEPFSPRLIRKSR
jgi:4'-phosphopantetheinyl transferase